MQLNSLVWLKNNQKIISSGRDTAWLFDPYRGQFDRSIPGPFYRPIPHPTHSDVFCMLCPAGNDDTPPRLTFYDCRTCWSSSTSTSTSSSNGICGHIDLDPSTVFSPAYAWGGDGVSFVLADRSDIIQHIELRTLSNAKTSRVKSKAIIAKQRYHTELNALTFESDRELLLAANDRGVIEAYPCNPLNLSSMGNANSPDKLVIKAHLEDCISLAAYGKNIVTGGIDGSITMHDLDTLNTVGSISKLNGNVIELDFSYDGSLLAWWSSRDDVESECPSSVCIGSTDPFEYQWRGNTTTRPNSISWHPSRHILAYTYDEPRHQHRSTGSSIGIFTFEK
eukprot:GHVO01010253.1.p1 GENE.GHVO01010253.1~~GHVO01010253.1.p1  ORF type:complete len:336 (+),score=38.69 GHVO01010253.1:312-1319(+)